MQPSIREHVSGPETPARPQRPAIAPTNSIPRSAYRIDRSNVIQQTESGTS